jgi:hypothetical protein
MTRDEWGSQSLYFARTCMTSSIAPSKRPEALTVLLEASSLLLDAASEDQLLAQALDLASSLLVADA